MPTPIANTKHQLFFVLHLHNQQIHEQPFLGNFKKMYTNSFFWDIRLPTFE